MKIATQHGSEVVIHLDSDDDVVLTTDGGNNSYLSPDDARNVATALQIAADSADGHRNFDANLRDGESE